MTGKTPNSSFEQRAASAATPVNPRASSGSTSVPYRAGAANSGDERKGPFAAMVRTEHDGVAAQPQLVADSDRRTPTFHLSCGCL
jgi:hypothetical protein